MKFVPECRSLRGTQREAFAHTIAMQTLLQEVLSHPITEIRRILAADEGGWELAVATALTLGTAKSSSRTGIMRRVDVESAMKC